MELRRAQQQLVEKVLDNVARRKTVTVALLAPGAGKTLGWEAAANELYRPPRGQVRTVVALAPRLNLCSQAELEWAQRHSGFPKPRMGSIAHAPNRRPLLKPDEWGYTTTYSSLVSKPWMHVDFAQEHLDQFLLVLDEAQILGMDEEQGTQAAKYVQQIQPLAFHTILLTATPERADGQPLLFASYGEKDAHGYRKLLADVVSGYREGITERYLRPYQGDLTDATMRHRWVGAAAAEEWRLSENSDELYKFIRQPEVWQPLVDQTVERIRRIKLLDPRYCGLIAAAYQDDIPDIQAYVAQHHPDMKVLVARSADPGKEGLRNLAQFRQGGHDLLITVRMAYIGYDHPPITAICVLTNFRDKGHLYQLVGRGMRVWRERPASEQHLYVIAPQDRKMQDFLVELRAETEAGLRERAHREGGDPPGPPRLGQVEETHIGDTATIGLEPDGDLEPAERTWLREQMERHHLVMAPESGVASLLRAAGGLILGRSAAPPAEPVVAAPVATKTREEQRREKGVACRTAIARYLAQHEGLTSQGTPVQFRDRVRYLNNWLNGEQRVPNVEHLSLEQWDERLRIIQSWPSGGAP
jgi:superfamily II DNA or RNA helicase